MSVEAQILNYLEAAARTALSLPAGADGWEVSAASGEDLEPGQYPHVFAHQMATTPTVFKWNTQELVYLVRLDVWVAGETGQALLDRLEALMTQIATDHTMGGAVERLDGLSRAHPDVGVVQGDLRWGTVLVTGARGD